MKTKILPAKLSDTDSLFDFLQAYYAYDNLEFIPATARASITEFINHPEYGRLWLIVRDGINIGYIAITFGYSLEFGGLDAFIDEFFILEEYRGKGIGTAILDQVEKVLKELKIMAFHLEVEVDSLNAQSFYKSKGFESRDRFHLMSKKL